MASCLFAAHRAARVAFSGVLALLLGLGDARAAAPAWGSGGSSPITLIPLQTRPVSPGYAAAAAKLPAGQAQPDPQAVDLGQRLGSILHGLKSTMPGSAANAAPSPRKGLSQAKPSPSAAAGPPPFSKKSMPPDLAALAKAPAETLDSATEPVEVQLSPLGSVTHMRGNKLAGRTGARRAAGARASLQANAPFLALADPREATAQTFLRRYHAHLKLNDPDRELSLIRADDDDLGQRHYRYAQQHAGLPVWPANLLVHLDSAGNVDSLDGSYIPTPATLDAQPRLDAEAALAAARAAVPEGDRGEAHGNDLIIYGPHDRPARLAWKVELLIGLEQDWLVLVDALTGAILNAYDNVQHANVAGSGVDLFGVSRNLNVWSDSGKFYLIDTSKQMFDPASTPPAMNTTRGAIFIYDAEHYGPPANQDIKGTLVQSQNAATGWLADGVSAAYHFSNTYDYYLTHHQRNSIDGKGGNIMALVRYGQDYANANWNPGLQGMMFGTHLPYARALDVIAHEMTHGVTEHTAALVYQDQAGALNEAMSDILGESTEAFVNGTADWKLGEDTTNVLRDFKNSMDAWPGHPYPFKMSQFYTSEMIVNLRCEAAGVPPAQCPKPGDPNFEPNTDHGGVHINSSIINRAYYLLVEGLTGAIGIVDAEKIFYRALAFHLTAQSQFIDARHACVQSAEELFGAASTQAARTKEAFDAVEILDAAPTPTPTPKPVVTGDDSVFFVSYSNGDNAWVLGRREPGLQDPDIGNYFLDGANLTFAAYKRPSVNGDGSMGTFVTPTRDVCLFYTDWSNVQCAGVSSVNAAAISDDGNLFAYVLTDSTTGLIEKKIHVINFTTQSDTPYDLLAPATEGGSVDQIQGADAMDFLSSNRQLVFDAFNVLSLADGTKVGAWSIYSLDLATGNISMVVAPRAGTDVGNPSIGHTSDDLITFEAREAATNVSTLYVGSLNTGDLQAVTEISGDPAGAPVYAAPTFAGDDAAVIYSKPDGTVPSLSSLHRVTPDGQTAPWLSDGDLAAVYRRGTLFKLDVTKNGTNEGTIRSDKDGIVCGSRCSSSFPSGTLVTISAEPGPGAIFAGWGGACSGNNASCQITMDQAKTASASFNTAPAPQTFELTLSKDGTGTGTVTSNPAGIDCGATCSASFNSGSVVVLTATPANGSTFAGWSGGCTGTGGCSVTMDQARSVTATFDQGGTQTFTLTTARSGAGTGSVTSNPAGIDCGATCSAGFNSGSVVVLTATPADGSAFAGWTGACTGTGTCSVTLTAAATATATFNIVTQPPEGKSELLVSTIGDTEGGTGRVVSRPAGINCGTRCRKLFTIGRTVRLIAKPAVNSEFVGWSGACTGSERICLLTLEEANHSVIANFAVKKVDLSVTVTGNGSVTSASTPAINCGAECSQTYPYGMQIVLTADAEDGASFKRWGGACARARRRLACTLTLKKDRQVTALFQ